MSSVMFMALVATTIASEPTDDLKRDMKALEIFLQDQEDHKEYCPSLKWEQPGIEVYKEELKSQLPKECKEK